MIHTPGPWKVWIEKSEDGRISVLEVCETEDRNRHKHFASIDKNWPEAEANARLIAAAPDLLAALEGMLDPATNEDSQWYIEAVRKARDAIAKAKGE